MGIRAAGMEMKIVKLGISACAIGVLAAVTSIPASAKSKQLSDKSVRVLMDYAWSLVPGKFTTPTGEVIITDKKNRKAAMVPMDVAREAIRVGRLTAHAQICGLDEEQVANFQTFMRLQREKNKWTPQQMLFINQLHLFTVMWLSGNAKITATGDGKAPNVTTSKRKATRTCTDEQRNKVRQTILKYVAAHPAPRKPKAVLPVKSDPVKSGSKSASQNQTAKGKKSN